jgi:hypothetical protein
MTTLPTRNLLKGSLLLGLLSVGAYACGQSAGSGGTGGSATGGAVTGSGGHAAGAGGSTSAGGSLASGGTMGSGGATSAGGSPASGGTMGSGGAQTAGGTVGTGGSNSGGAKATGGTSSSSTATGGSSSGTAGAGGAANGGSSGNTSTGGAAGGGTGGTSSGSCQKGQVKPSEVVFMGESFYAIDPQYNEKRVEANAQAAGALAAGAKYRNVAISGQPMSVVAGEFDTALQGGAVKFVIMDGGGIDCMSSSCSSCPDTFKTLLTKMASNGVQNVIYTRYPEPGNPPGSNATLKGNLDTLMPKMQAVCAAATGLHCYWVDLRPVWVNGDTSDGLHPTQSGGNHVGDLIWAEMVKDCLAQ